MTSVESTMQAKSKKAEYSEGEEEEGVRWHRVTLLILTCSK